MQGWIAPTDYDWFSFLLAAGPLEEVNFWKPSAARRFNAEPFSPFLFKLKSPHNSICGYGLFARYSSLPTWLAWEAFQKANGCASERSMNERITVIRHRMHFRGESPSDHIGCILLVNPVFFSKDQWISQPNDWPPRNLGPMRYDLDVGEGKRVWSACLDRTVGDSASLSVEGHNRFGTPTIIHPRLGQGTFRISVTDAYGRACAVTGEHSLPALEAAHIRAYSESGPHEISNGLLLRADIHRLFDQGYVTVTPDLRFAVSQKLREDFQNGRTYYPLHDTELRPPTDLLQRPHPEFLEWHNEHVFRH